VETTCRIFLIRLEDLKFQIVFHVYNE